MKKGKLYLIPVTLGDNNTISKVLPAYVLEVLRNLDYFIVENSRSARRFISAAGHNKAIDELTFYELDKHQKNQNINAFLQPLLKGISMGVMSEAGTPAVADPGSEIVNVARQNGVEVVPLTGPNSIILALMASGFNGQGFVFHGYLPVEKNLRIKKLRELEANIAKYNQTQIFIETPYRNNQMIETILKCCKPQTKLSIACDLTLSSQWINTLTVSAWKKETVNLHKRPTVFLLFK
jgi:16S rRNA (cytidine1402-2'-O)-methyltransferase